MHSTKNKTVLHSYRTWPNTKEREREKRDVWLARSLGIATVRSREKEREKGKEVKGKERRVIINNNIELAKLFCNQEGMITRTARRDVSLMRPKSTRPLKKKLSPTDEVKPTSTKPNI